MSATATTGGLTKTDVAALRKADDVTFHYFEGRHYIRAWKRATFADRERDPWADDRYHEIAVDGRVTNYEKDGRDVESCFANVTHHTRSVWQGVARAGDRLAIEWVRGNYSQTTRESGLAVDEVKILVERDGVKGTKRLEFLAEVSVTGKNSARMTRSASEVRS